MAPSTRPKSTACWPRTTEGTFQPSRRDHYGGSDPPKGEGSWCAHKGAPATLPRCRTSGLKRGVAPSMMTRPARHLPDGGMARRAVRFCRGELEGFAAPLYRCGFGHLSGKAGHSGGGVPPLGERLRARHHLGAPGTLRRMCAYLPARLRPPQGESVNPPTLSPLAGLAHHLVQASVLLDRLPITLFWFSRLSSAVSWGWSTPRLPLDKLDLLFQSKGKPTIAQ